MNLGLTGTETADELIKQLVYLRFLARRIVAAKRRCRAFLKEQKHIRDNIPPHMPEWAPAAQAVPLMEENMLQWDSMEIEIGNFLMPLCNALDQKATRDQICEALNINPVDRDTDMVREYGSDALSLICVQHLENSASTRGEDFASPETQPLQWCHTLAFMRAIKTNPKLDRIVHDGANEFFGGVFGEYRERPLMERLAGRAV